MKEQNQGLKLLMLSPGSLLYGAKKTSDDAFLFSSCTYLILGS